MAPSYCIELTPDEEIQLPAIARRSIKHGLTTNQPLDIGGYRLTDSLAERHGNFVTLMHHELLRGCVGTVGATHLPLAQSVAINAFRAAFSDRRFNRLSAAEMDQIRIEISILSRPEPIEVKTCQELLGNLHPGEDGLLLECAGYHATFLPKVWEKIPDPQQFIKQLLAKAGLPEDFWSDSIRFHRYQAVSVTEPYEESIHGSSTVRSPALS